MGDALPLHFRTYIDMFCKRFRPSSSQHRLEKCLLPVVWMPLGTNDQTFCLYLQPLSTGDASSSISTASNRSRNRTRYRTKAMNSEVDESLFGGVKVTHRQ